MMGSIATTNIEDQGAPPSPDRPRPQFHLATTTKILHHNRTIMTSNSHLSRNCLFLLQWEASASDFLSKTGSSAQS
jgi:hypothetical protein